MSGNPCSTADATPGTAPGSGYAVGACLAVVLLVHAGLLGWSGWLHSPVRGEYGQLPAGVAHWQVGRFDLYRVNPPLVRMTAALPVPAYAPHIEWPGISADPLVRQEWDAAGAMVRAGGEQVLWWFTLARWVCIPFSLLGAWICFRWATELYGARAGLTAAVLWCFSPTVLGHGALITPDVGSAAAGAAAGYLFWRWLKQPSAGRAFAAGAVLGLAQLTKFTWLILFALWPLLWLLWRRGARTSPLAPAWREARHLALMMAVALYVINLGYGFEGTGTRLGDLRFVSRTLRAPGGGTPSVPVRAGNRFAGTFWSRMPIPVPANYVAGIDRQKYDFDEAGFWSYLRGQWRQGGWWYYYLYALAIKEPLGTWLLVLLAVGATIAGRQVVPKWRDELLVVAPAVAVLVLVSSQTGFNHHMRYVLPMFPFAFIWISRAARDAAVAPAFRLLVAGALVWSVGSSLSQYPHTLSYFNELVGGPRQGHHHLLDSNIDWGQDLLPLKRWLDRHPEVQPIAVAHQVPPWMLDAAGMHLAPLRVPGGPEPEQRAVCPQKTGPLPGWYAIFVAELRARHRRYDYFLHFEPVAMVGYTVYIYHITADDANRVRRALGMPEIGSEGGSRVIDR